ncbi:MAG: Putative homoserine kinase type II (Protein kinase fold)-like protein [Microgenomates bacterium 39_7]|nr:MAG: Putative homoserine kinase type II (Protein kinase fold)-like protein [Microgenomates bacterium 39_7]
MPLKVTDSLVKKVLQQYRIGENFTILKPESGYRNTVVPIKVGGKTLSIIFYKDEPKILQKIKVSNLISNSLAKKGWPTRHVVSKSSHSILKLHHSTQTYYCCLYNYLPGNTINWENYSKKHIKLLGQVLGFLHQDLKLVEVRSDILVDKIYLILDRNNNKMYKYFTNKEVTDALEQKLKLKVNLKFREKLNSVAAKLKNNHSEQLLHMDFVRGNILFCKQNNYQFVQDSRLIFDDDKKENNQQLAISGILDFEKVALGPREVELARTLAFLLVDCKYKAPQKVLKYFLYSGYLKRGQQQNINVRLVSQLVKHFLFQDFYYFLLHNPYESLPQNEHFTRTCKFLLSQTNPVLISLEQT